MSGLDGRPPTSEELSLMRSALPSRVEIEEDPGGSVFEIEKGLRVLESSGGRAALELKRAREDLVKARQELRHAKTAASLRAKQLRGEDGKPLKVAERAQYIDDETDAEQYALDLADVIVKYTADLVNERASTRSSLQTRAKLVMESMRLAGTGRQP
jgi:hypothetical protein